MAQSQLIRVQRKISRKILQLEKAMGRVRFFEQCLKNKVIPQSLLVKPPDSQTSDPVTVNRYYNAAMSSSLRNLNIALIDAKSASKQEKANFEACVAGVGDTIGIGPET